MVKLRFVDSKGELINEFTSKAAPTEGADSGPAPEVGRRAEVKPLAPAGAGNEPLCVEHAL